AALGYYRNEGAVGVALRRTADNGRWSISGGLSGSSGGVAARAGLGGIVN
ncbi:MAG: YadA-like family protein, partial [Proteobacteria bacterium]|nr:YadA-like family protein [Pseudomonadota bacterium]